MKEEQIRRELMEYLLRFEPVSAERKVELRQKLEKIPPPNSARSRGKGRR